MSVAAGLLLAVLGEESGAFLLVLASGSGALCFLGLHLLLLEGHHDLLHLGLVEARLLAFEGVGQAFGEFGEVEVDPLLLEIAGNHGAD